MPDYSVLEADALKTLNDVYALESKPTIADPQALQTQLDAANTALVTANSTITSLNTKIANAVAAAQADKAADDAREAGQGVLDALA